MRRVHKRRVAKAALAVADTAEEADAGDMAAVDGTATVTAAAMADGDADDVAWRQVFSPSPAGNG